MPLMETEYTVAPLPPRYRFRDLIWGDHALSDEDRNNPLRKWLLEDPAEEQRVRVEFFINERTFKERLQLYFIKNQRSSLRIRIFNLVIKILTCVLYILRVCLDDPTDPASNTCVGPDPCHNYTWVTLPKEEFKLNPVVKWEFILWVQRDTSLWVIQTTVAIISLTETLLVTYLGYKGNILQLVLKFDFIVEISSTVPFIATAIYPSWSGLFIPVFMNCWLAKSTLENMFGDLHRVMQKSQSALSQQMMILGVTVLCLIFTSTCGVQHLQRGGNEYLNLFEALWFVIVSFSTVGYGDIAPDIWPSRLFMMVMVTVSLLILPTQMEQLAYTWMERQKQGGTYSTHRAQNEKHVVVCATNLVYDSIMDFLNEFYAHPKVQDYYVVLLSPCELDPTLKTILQVPLWAQRVIYIQGSALKDADLSRCRIQDAEACFFLAARNYDDKTAADEHTILRSWAVKDFAPSLPQCVQIFRPENKFHVKFAEHVVCEDEFKYALLANNCLAPATSTLVTLLLHTSRGQEGQTSNEEWQRIYGRCSGNEIYHIRLEDSQFFREYEGKSFTFASFHAHRKFGVSLIGIQKDLPGCTIQLNPGPRHIMKKTDMCFYMSITKEENSAFVLAHPSGKDTRWERMKLVNATTGKPASKVASTVASVGTVALDLQHTRTKPDTHAGKDALDIPEKLIADLPKGLSIQSLNRRPSIAPVPAVLEARGVEIAVDTDSESEEPIGSEEFVYPEEEEENDEGPFSEYVKGFPPAPPYIGISPTLCHLLKEKRPLCCLQLSEPCEHNTFTTAKEYNWLTRAIILVADYASSGMYNFIVPLRSHCRPKHTLNPIVVLLEKIPDQKFIETICYFPMVYWMIGYMDDLDDLLTAGINMADHVVLVNKEKINSYEDSLLADSNTIVAVQTIFRLFPGANIISELSQSANMRFMQFRAHDLYALNLSRVEKKERERGSNIPFMFRLPFATGNVFSASFLDTLLYQAFVKEYLITFARLLLGLDQAVGSGHLSCMKITKDDLWIRTYGRLYQKLCSTTCEVPIGIYRSAKHKSPGPSDPSFSAKETSLNVMYKDQTERPGVDKQTYAERQEIRKMVKYKMERLGYPLEDYKEDVTSEQRQTISYVIINPGYDLKLEIDDVIYLIKPSSLSPKASPLIDERKLSMRRPGKRQEPTGADVDITGSPSSCKKGSGAGTSASTISKVPILSMDSDDDLNEGVSSLYNHGVRGTIV